MSIHEFVHPDDLRSDQRVADQVLSLMLAAIRDRELSPGSVIHDYEWAEALGVSRTPVREAIQRLLGIGLVEIAAARYTKLRSFTPTEASHEARDWALLHSALVASLIHHTPDGLAETLELTLSRFRATVDPRQADVFSFDLFHTLRNARPTSAISLGAHAAAYRLRLAEPTLPHRLSTDAEIHTAVTTAICGQDAECAHRALTVWATREQYAGAA